MPNVTFDPGDGHTARVLKVGTKQWNEKGALRAWAILMVTDADGQEFEVMVGCAAWLSYLHSSLLAMAETPDQAFCGFHLRTRAEYVDLLGLEGIKQPDDWDAQLEAMGLNSGVERVPSNGKPPLRPPSAAGVSGSGGEW